MAAGIARKDGESDVTNAKDRVGYAVAVAIVAAATAIAWLAFGQGYSADVLMLYLLGVVVASLLLGRGPSFATALLSVATFDFFFIPPYRRFTVDDPHHLVTFGVMLLVAGVTQHLARRVRDQAVEAERERLRNALLSSVSHDLRTPLGVIEGAASTLLAEPFALNAATRLDLLETIHEEAQSLNRRVRNLLDMTRLESGAIALDLEWQSIEEVVGAALERVERGRVERRISVDLPGTLPLIRCDGELMEAVLVNLLENAMKYSRPGSPVGISAAEGAGELRLSVADSGPGLPAGQEERIFAKFHRATSDRRAGGVGLGLAICRAIVAAHGGRIWAENREGGGAVFHVGLPRGGAAPAAPPEEAPA